MKRNEGIRKDNANVIVPKKDRLHLFGSTNEQRERETHNRKQAH